MCCLDEYNYSIGFTSYSWNGHRRMDAIRALTVVCCVSIFLCIIFLVSNMQMFPFKFCSMKTQDRYIATLLGLSIVWSTIATVLWADSNGSQIFQPKIMLDFLIFRIFAILNSLRVFRMCESGEKLISGA